MIFGLVGVLFATGTLLLWRNDPRHHLVFACSHIAMMLWLAVRLVAGDRPLPGLVFVGIVGFFAAQHGVRYRKATSRGRPAAAGVTE